MENKPKCISIMVPTYNESENVLPLADAIIAEFNRSLPQYDYEILFIDNRSTDDTRDKISQLCADNPHIRAIFNARNFGQFNSPFYGICQTTGDCTIPLCADFQDPIEMIPKLVQAWEEGHKVVCAVKTSSRENKLIRFFRTCYYKLIRKTSSVEQIDHFTGFGLYDRCFVDVLRDLDDPTPFIRGIVAELGFSKIEIPYEQARRKAGHTHNNFRSLYDAAMLSFTTYTKTPVRICTGIGATLLPLSVLAALILLIVSLVEDSVSGLYFLFPLVSFLSALQLLFTGIVGEYVLTVRSKVLHRPLVIEEKRLNFDRKNND